jgi:hypothetical protein
MKGQAILISYTLAVLLAVIFITFSSVMFFSFYSSFLKNQVRSNLESLSLKLYSSITTAYEIANNSEFLPKNNSCILLQEINLNFPPKISGKNYEIHVQPSEQSLEIKAKALDYTETFEIKLPKIYANFEGKIESGKKTNLYYYRCNLNNAISDKIILGEIEGI